MVGEVIQRMRIKGYDVWCIIAGSKFWPRHCTIKLRSWVRFRMIALNQLGAPEILLSATW